MSKVRMKRGDTFIINASVGFDITGWSIRSQIRDKDTLVVDLDIEIVDALAGDYVMTCDPTTNWPTKNLTWDIEYTRSDGVVVSTETIILVVEADVTR